MSKGSIVAMLHAVEKAFLVAQPIQLVAVASPVAYQLVTKKVVIANGESLQVRVRKASPPPKEVISAPFGTRKCQNGVSPNSVKCCSIAKSGLLRAGLV